MTDTIVVTEIPAGSTEPITETPVAPPSVPAVPAAPSPEAPAAPAETPATPAAEPPAVDERTRKGWEAVTKAEREVTRKRQEIEKRDREITERTARVEQVEKVIAMAKDDPLGAFKALGLDLNAVVRAHLKEGEPPTADDRVTQLEKKLADKEKAEAAKAEAEAAARADAEKRKHGEVITQFRENVARDVAAAGETFELVNAYKAYPLVTNVIEAHYRETAKAGKPELLTAAQAAAMVEDHLEEQAKIALTSKKLSARLTPPAPVGAKPPAPAPAAVTPKRASPTLTNSSAATPSSPPATRGVPSREEGIAAAVARMRAGRKSA